MVATAGTRLVELPGRGVTRVWECPGPRGAETLMLSAGAVAEMEESFDELAPEIRDQAAAQLDGSGLDWGFERLQGLIPEGLIAVATGLGDARPGQTVVIVVGSSSHATHRVVGSVTVSLARHSPVPIIIVP